MQIQLHTLRTRVHDANLPSDVRTKLTEQLDRLDFIMTAGNAAAFSFYDQTVTYVQWVLELPWYNKSTDMLDIARAKQIFNKNHYGLDQIKHRILEYLSVIIMQRKSELGETPHEEYTPLRKGTTEQALSAHKDLRAPILCFVGLVGTGKTTMAVSLAEALNRKVIRIPFGGLSSALDLRGLSRIHNEAEPGIVMRSLRRVGVNNPVILLDELDRVSDTQRSEIMGVLVELLDPAQNQAFTDHYIDMPFDLSGAIFVATANNINKVATAVIDRMEIIQMPSYTDEEKNHIAKQYLLPRAMEATGMDPSILMVDDVVWPILVRPLGFDPGIRSLNRNIEGMVRKAAWKLLNGEGTSFKVTSVNYREFLEG
ncbi:MAG: AAA family ATPase [Candidatus Roizmanbacteria bacterium]|nr:AAA family ATPase [Candidatus Roizmanbacteria bacterium]